MRLAVKLAERLRPAYRRTVPARIRDPLGILRRRMDDRWIRMSTRGPLPPRSLLQRVQMSGWVREYLEVGERCAATLQSVVDQAGLGPSPRVLDFGCGLGRTLRPLSGRTDWKLEGCDIDAAQIEWTRGAFPSVSMVQSPSHPPLPWEAASFDVVYAVSVFTHFDRPEQKVWAAELARILRPGGLLLASTMGPSALEAFPDLDRAETRAGLSSTGFLFLAPDGSTFNSRGAFHLESGIRELWTEGLELEEWRPGGLDGFQDLSLLVRTPMP